MTRTEAIKLINKYIHDDLSEREMERLSAWVKEHPTHKSIFREQVEINYLLLDRQHEVDLSAVYQKIEQYLNPADKKSADWRRLLKYAAIFIAVVGLGIGGYFLNSSLTNKGDQYKTITLKLQDGKVKTLDQGIQKDIVSEEGLIVGSQQKNRLTYRKNDSVKKLVYNTLYVPNGKTFQLLLSDGTQITLNADSKITYPVNFIAGHKRKIQLEGEAYFQVATDSSRQFVVNTAQQQIKVYGTTFNIKAYPDYTINSTVLVEGSVGVSNKNGTIRLSPGEMASPDKQGKLKVKTVDPYIYTAWTRGAIIFRSERFDEITKTLERKFDVKIENHYPQLNTQRFSAGFKDENLDEILALFTKSRAFQFEHKGNRIIISKPHK